MNIELNMLNVKKAECTHAGNQSIIPDADQLVSEWVQEGANNHTISYNYNGNGELTNVASNSDSTHYTYDYNNRLESVDDGSLPSGQNGQGSSFVDYLYDASGARVGRIHNSVTNYFVVDYADGLKRPLAETDASGTISRYYVWSGMRLLCHIEADGTTRYYHADELGSTLALTDETGSLAAEFAYMPYGHATANYLTPNTSNLTPFLWLGGYGVYYDSATDLHLTLYRAYSSSLKRFISPDPLGIDGGVNVYMWANMNPLYFIDPTGLYNQLVSELADISLNDPNPWMRFSATVMGPIVGMVPDIITLDGRTAGALLGGGEFGAGAIINLSDGSISGYDTRGLGVGNQALAPSLTLGAGWYTEGEAPNNSAFDGVFHEFSASWTRPGAAVGETASMYFGGGWFGVNYGVTTPGKFGYMYSAVDYDVWDGSDSNYGETPWYDIINFSDDSNQWGPLK